MKSNLRVLEGNPHRPDAGPGLSAHILRLVKSAPERRAIASGQIDAVIDPATGKAFLLPDAQQAQREDGARVRSLLALASDWSWEQDESHRFVSHTGAASGSSGVFDESIIGKTLRDPPFDGMSVADWQTHRRLLDWRAAFRDFELMCADRAGGMRSVSISGEPIFDAQDQFKGYRGTMRDITLRKQSEASASRLRTLAPSSRSACCASGSRKALPVTGSITASTWPDAMARRSGAALFVEFTVLAVY